MNKSKKALADARLSSKTLAEKAADEQNNQATSSATPEAKKANEPKSSGKGKKTKPDSVGNQFSLIVPQERDSSDDEPILF